MAKDKAKIIEIFSSVQGEGLYAGQIQTFARFYGCNMKCGFCDESRKNKFKEYSVRGFIDSVAKENNRVVSLTGGEPLLYADFLKEALPVMKKKGLVIYLETNGMLKNKLLEIIDFLDIISMDMKLPSSTGLRGYWKQHSDFLKAASRKKVFVKSVITNTTTESDIRKAVSVIKSVDRDIFFVLQPASVNGRIRKIKSIRRFLEIADSGLNNVRLIPQIHKILGLK